MACSRGKENDTTVPTCDSLSSSSHSSRSCSESRENKPLKRVAESDFDETITCSLLKQTKASSVSGGSQSSLISSSGRSALDIDGIPGKTSFWTEHHLSQLNIVIDGSTASPIGVFSSGYTEFLKNDPKHSVPEIIEVLYGSRSSENLLQAKFDCCKYACTSFIGLDIEALEDIPVQHILNLNIECNKPFQETRFNEWQEAYLVGKSKKIKDYIEDICRSIHVRVRDFCGQLLYMVQLLHRKESEDLTEGMYQELFMSFVRIFDLKIVGFSNVQPCNLSIFGRKNVISVPDAVICKVDPSSLKDKVIAVVEVQNVKKKCSKSDDNISLPTLQGSEKKINVVDHIDSDLKGQHVGEMLAVLPKSVFGLSGIYGIVVQGTEVTIASMVVGKEYFEKLMECSVHKVSSTVKYSKPYNFLRVKERERLIQTFLDMGTLLDHLG